MNRYTRLECFWVCLSLILLTAIIPLLQWLAGKLIGLSSYNTLIGNAIVIMILSSWCLRKGLFNYLPSLPVGRWLFLLLVVSVFVLLILNVLHRPVSEITGQARSPYKVVDVIVLGSIAEELVFRGAIWSLITRLARSGNENKAALVGTSLLFGFAHLGYWMQSSWPLPANAYIHSLSMILAGIFFGTFRLKTNSLPVPILIHMLANGIILLWQ